MHGLWQRRVARQVRRERAHRGEQAWLRVGLGDAGAVPVRAVSSRGGALVGSMETQTQLHRGQRQAACGLLGRGCVSDDDAAGRVASDPAGADGAGDGVQHGRGARDRTRPPGASAAFVHT